MKYHFTPEKGWINDPNGTIYVDGEYHLFYQYFPDDIVWGPMHWGHAVSRDLITFEHKEIALFPDELGYIFSGSCVLDKNNVSGFGKGGRAPLIAMYTSHNPETAEQQQSIAYSLDYEHFIVYEGNPVIKNTIDMSGYQKEYRDPKIFENPIKGGYSMALAVDRNIEFYHSDNLIDWNKTGVFYPGEFGFDGMCECPDCFALNVDTEEKWILTVSMILPDEYVGKPLEEKGYGNSHVMQYFVGEFDGDTFAADDYGEPLILDYGPDNYAMVTFANMNECVMIGWGEHWAYVRNTPATTKRGKMTIPRKLELVNVDDSYRLKFSPYLGEKINGLAKTIELLPGEKYEIELNSLGDDEKKLVISLTDEEIIVDRSNAVDKKISEKFEDMGYNIFSAKRVSSGKDEIIVVEDEGYYEIFADNGFAQFSIMTY